MRRLMIMIIGLALLVAAGLLIWQAHGPQPKEERTTGGVLYTQPELAASGVLPAAGGEPNLDVVTDEGSTSTSIVGAAQMEAAALSDAVILDNDEIQEVPPTLAEVTTAPGTPPLTNDVVLDETTGVAVAPLALSQGVSDAPGQGGPAVAANYYEQRVVELEWPQEFRVGRSASLRIKLKMLSGGALQPIAEIADNEVIATPILITDRYDTHTAFVTATISAPDFDITSVSNASQPLERGQEAEWRWTLKPEEAGKTVLVIGLSITWQPRTAEYPAYTNIPIWGQTLQANVHYIIGGLTVDQASIAGMVIAVLGFAAQIPMVDKLLEIFWGLFFGRRRRDRDRRR